MPGLRSLVARRRSTLASPQYSSSSKTPPPPSTSNAFCNAQKIERRCNSLPGQVSLDVYEANEDSRLVHPCVNGSSLLNGVSNGSILDPRQVIAGERQKERANTSLGAIRPSESGNRFDFASSSGNSNSSSSSSSSSVKSNTAMEIESTLARRGVTVVRRMVESEDNSKCNKKEVLPYPLKESVITANPLIAKENSKSNSEGAPKQPSSIPTSVPSSVASLLEQPKRAVSAGQVDRSTNLSREFYKQPQNRELYEKSDRVLTDTHRDTGQSHSRSNYEPHMSVSTSFSAQTVAANRDFTINNNSQRFSGQSYYNHLSHQQNVKELAMQGSPSKSGEYHSVKESFVANTQGSLKTNSSEMSAPLGPSVLPCRSVAQYSPQPRSAPYQQPKTPARMVQFPETSSPLSKSSEVSPQPRSADMSPYSRSSEASPTSRSAQVSPHSRSSQISPLSRSVKASPHSRSAEVSPQSRTQASPLMRSGDLSPKSRYIGLSPQSSSVESPQSRSSGYHAQPISSTHQNHNVPAVNTSLHAVGHPHLSSSERHMAQNMPMSHTSQVAPAGPLQQGTPSRLASSSSQAGFPNIPTSEFPGRSVSDMFPSCNNSEVLSPQSNAVGFPAQLNSVGFGMHSNPGSFLSQGNNVSFPTSSLGYPQEGTPSQFSGINNVPGVGMVTNTNSNMGGFGNLSNCGGFSLHDISGLYGSHPNPGVYNIPNSTSDLRSANTAEVLNYVASRDFSMHTPYRDFSSYSSSNQVSNQVRSQEISAHNQRDVLANHSSRDTTLQNCNQVMPVHQGARNPSVGSMGREAQIHQNYGEQQLQPGYRESSLFQRSNSDVSSSLPESRDSTLRQNFRETAASSHYKSDHLSNNYRDSASHNNMRSTPAPSSYREHPVLSNASDYQSSNTRGSNLLNSFREPSVLANYRDQDVLSNYLTAPGTPVASSYREPNTHTSNREQVMSNYRDIVNHTSPTEQTVPIPAYQDTLNPPNPRNTVRSNYPNTVSHASPSETIPSRYRDAINHASPGEQVPGYGESVNHGNTRDMLPSFQEMRSPTCTSEQELSNYRDTVTHTSPREQVMLGFQHTVNHTSPRHHSLPAFKESVNPVIPVEQNVPSYHSTIDHASPREQAYPIIQKDRNHGYRENNHTSPRQSLPGFGEGVGHASPRKSLSSFRESIEHPSPSQQVIQGFKESMDYGNMRDSLDCCSSDESPVKRGMHEFGPGYGSIGHTPSHEVVGANNYGELQGLQNFRVLSQHRSPNEFLGTTTETKTAVLPSFTESFENTSHNKLCVTKPSYKGARDISFYGDPRANLTPVDCEKYCEDVPYEKMASCSSDREVHENPADEDAGVGVKGPSECEKVYADSCDRSPIYSNERSPHSHTDIGETQEWSSAAKCSNTEEVDNVIPSDPTTEIDLSDDISRNVLQVSSALDTAQQNSVRASATNHGASPEMISNQREQPPEFTDTQQEEEISKPEVSNSSPLRSAVGSSSDDSPEKAERGESSGKLNLGASPSSQERIVIKMKLLHSKPGDEGDFHNGKYLGNNETGSDRGNYIRYPMVKYTRWTIDSIINGREDGAAEVPSPGTIKRENDERDEEECSDDHGSSSESPKRTRKRRSTGSLSSSKVTKFDTNKNLMKKSLKITITNPLRARVSPRESVDANPVMLKCEEEEDSVIKQEPEEQYVGGGSADTDKSMFKRETSSLRKVRKEREKCVRSPFESPTVESYLSSSGASRTTRSARRRSSHSSVTSEDLTSVMCAASGTSSVGFAVPRMKKCSIVIKRIYTEDNYSCYSSRLCDKNSKVKTTGDSILSAATEQVKRPKRKAAIEANERRHKSLRSFDRSLELFNTVNSEKVPYNGPISKYRNLMPLMKPPLPLVKTSSSMAEGKNNLPQCSVLVCDIFMNRRINKMTCPGCSRKYDSSDSVRVNLNKMLMSLMCCQCRWEVVKHVKPREVEAMEPR